MSDEQLPKEVFYEELQVGKCSQGGQKKRYKDTLKASLNDLNIPPDLTYHQSPGNRLHWIKKSGISSSEREQMTMKQRESANQKEST